MAFREGIRGHSLWPLCLKHGVAAISYNEIDHVDLAKYPGKKEPGRLWAMLNSSQQSSLFRLANVMSKGDIIYVKEGREIVGRGRITGPYKYALSKKTLASSGHLWPHQVPVDWDRLFNPIPVLLGAELHTVLELNEERISKLGVVNGTFKEERIQFGREGKVLERLLKFRERNRAIIIQMKRISPPNCQACGMNFEANYGPNAKNCLQVHHKNPLAEQKGTVVTKLSDLVITCPNCHAVIHSFDPPLRLEKIAFMIKRVNRRRRK